VVKKRRIEITVETERLLTIRSAQRSASAWCRECGSRVSTVTVDEAASLIGESQGTIYRRVEDGSAHFIDRQEPMLLICLDSLWYHQPRPTESISSRRSSSIFKS
jgi:hypothetical protein